MGQGWQLLLEQGWGTRVANGGVRVATVVGTRVGARVATVVETRVRARMVIVGAKVGKKSNL